jgi:hypothetical protein
MGLPDGNAGAPGLKLVHKVKIAMRYTAWLAVLVTVLGVLGIVAPLWTVVFSDSTSVSHTRLTVLALYFGIGAGLAILVFGWSHALAAPRYMFLVAVLGVLDIMVAGYFLWLITSLCGTTVLWGDCQA